MVGAMIDKTEEKKAREKLKQSERYYRNIFEKKKTKIFRRNIFE
jgi:PAS domain-containing protein